MKFTAKRKILRNGIKRCLGLFIVVFAQVMFTGVYAQSTNLTIQQKNITVKEVLTLIEKNSQVVFFYTDKDVDLNRRVSIDVKNKPASEVLNQLFKNSTNNFKIDGKQVYIYKKDKPVEKTKQETKSTKISGVITDDKNEAVIGATITVNGTNNRGTISDINGNFSIEAPENGQLKISYIGSQTQIVDLDGKKTYEISMFSSAHVLDEAVVVGYGKQKRFSLVGAVTTIEPKTLQMGATRSISNNLAGQLAGIIAVQRSGEPGYDNATFWIRGISTFSNGTRSPLVIIDGIDRDLNGIDPAEIESFSILKDASATAVYGVRGANGVVIINTKRGQIGKPKIDFRYERTYTQPVQLPKFIGAADYMGVFNSIRKESGGAQLFSQTQIDNTINKVDPDLYPDTNWLNEITNDYATNSRSNLTISGGTKMLRYSVVTSVYNETGITSRDKNQEWDSSLKLSRYNIRTNVDMNVTPTTMVRVNIGGYLQNDIRPSTSLDGLFGYAFETVPYQIPTIYSTGQIPRVTSRNNPWAMLTQSGYTRNSASTIQSLFSVDQDLKFFIPGLSATAKFSFDRTSKGTVARSKNPKYWLPATGKAADGSLITFVSDPGTLFLGTTTSGTYGNQSVYLEGNIAYTKTIKKNYIDAMFLYNQRNYDDGSSLPFLTQGVSGRFSYSYDRRYIAEFNFGYNGSENFAPGKRFGFFPSAALGWYISEEPFMASVKKTISKLKIRGSYGSVGNDKLEGRRFAYLTTIGTSGGYAYGEPIRTTLSGLLEGDYGVPTLTWETVDKANLGMELGLFDMLNLQVDVFKEQRHDIFMQRRSIPASAGFIKTPWDNYGKVNNQGVEVSLDFTKQFTKDFFLSVKGNFTYAANKVMEIDEPTKIVGTSRSQTGHPVGQIFGLIADGLYTTDDFADVSTGKLVSTLPAVSYVTKIRPGDIKYVDINKDGKLDDLDKTAIGGTVDPQIVYGFGLNMRYKKVDFGIFFQGNAKTTQVIGGGFFLPGSGSAAIGNIYTNVTDRWTVDNPRQNVFYPRLTEGANVSNNQPSTWWLKDKSMMRLKNIEIGYSFPMKLISKVTMQNARIYVKGDNLFTFSSFKLWDPELDTSNGFRYPIMKSVSLGLNIGF